MSWIVSGRDQTVALLRRHEQMARSDGEFETAVQFQHSADTVELHGLNTAELRMCCWFQRGRDRIPYHHEINGLLGIETPNGLIHFMTEDVCYHVLMVLLHHLNIGHVHAVKDGWEFYEKAPQ